MKPLLKNGGLSLAGALVVAAPLAAVTPGNPWRSLLAEGVLLWISFFLLLLLWRWSGSSRLLACLMAAAFFLRLGVGVGISLALPVYGYDEETQNAGYLFRDAHKRDQIAWELAQPGKPLWPTVKKELSMDQYGGLSSLSAMVYRLLSLDAHRPFLILILGAFFTAMGVPFFHRAVTQRWEGRLGKLAAWVMVLYPDGILFGASQMREPFLLGLGCIAFWAVLAWNQNRLRSLLVFAASMAGMTLISSRAAVAILGFLVVWFFLDIYLPKHRTQKWMLWAGIFVIVAALLLMMVGWFIESSQWDMTVTETQSGWVHKIIVEAGEQYRIPIILAYGLAQPVLPAAIADPAPWIWKAISIPRAAGWYALAPFLLYAAFSVWKTKPKEERRILVWMTLYILMWLLVASARGGGDQWDNPRYRTIFLPWLALTAAWAIDWGIKRRDLWLARWLLVEIIFLGFFTQWYFSRYFQIWGRMYFWQTVAWVAGLSGLVLVSGWLWDLGKWILSKRRN